MEYKYELLKGSYKGYCPRCGKKRFVPLVYKGTRELVDESRYGRCDREQECGYILYPSGKGKTDKAPKAPQIKEIPFYINVSPPAGRSLQNGYVSGTYMERIPELTPEAVDDAFRKYHCVERMDSITFYQVDASGKVRTAKRITYNPDAHRSHTKPPAWLHKQKEIKDLITPPEGNKLVQCFFGLQTIQNIDNEEPVYVVEGEKTALYMHALTGLCFIATGGVSNLSGQLKDAAAVLNGRNIYLLPDRGCKGAWLKAASAASVRCKVFDWYNIQEYRESPEGSDLLDAVVLFGLRPFLHCVGVDAPTSPIGDVAKPVRAVEVSIDERLRAIREKLKAMDAKPVRDDEPAPDNGRETISNVETSPIGDVAKPVRAVEVSEVLPIHEEIPDVSGLERELVRAFNGKAPYPAPVGYSPIFPF